MLGRALGKNTQGLEPLTQGDEKCTFLDPTLPEKLALHSWGRDEWGQVKFNQGQYDVRKTFNNP